jgi:hypothetical protein
MMFLFLFLLMMMIRVAPMWEKLPAEMDKLSEARPQARQLWRRRRGFNHQASCSPREPV